jgi:hypothetical protein
VFGPAYLLQNAIRRRRGTLPPPAAKTPAEQARAGARTLRAGALATLLTVPSMVVVAATDDLNPLAGAGLTPVLLIVAGLGASGAPYLWGLAEFTESGRSLRWAWALAGAIDLAFAVTALVVAATNLANAWVGGGGWTVAFALAGLCASISAAANLSRTRRPGTLCERT